MLRKDVQLLRGFSIIVVVAYHLNVNFIPSGFIGVDIFFVISGFLMAMSFNGNASDFIIKRLARLLPAYYFTLFLFLTIGYFVFSLNDYGELVKQSLYSFTFLSNVYYFNLNSYFSDNNFKPLIHFWSLALEIQFYLILPFIFRFFGRDLKAVCFILLGSLSLCWLVLSISSKTAFFILPFRLWEFYFGVLGFLLLKRNLFSLSKYTFWILCGVLLSLSLIPISPTSNSFIIGHPGLLSFTACLITLIILVGNVEIKDTKSILFNSLVRVGDYSYSIYLIHFPFIVLFGYSAYQGNNFTFTYVDAFLCLIITLFLSAFSYHYVEGLFKILRQDKTKFYIINLVIIISAAFISLGALFYKKQTSPFSEIVIDNTLSDRAEYRCGFLGKLNNFNDFACPLFDEDSKTERTKALLIGDSHADALKKVLQKVLLRQGFDLFLNINNYSVMINADYLATSLKYIDDNGIKKVIIHDSYGKFSESLFRQFVEALIDRGVDLVILGGTPEFKTSVPKRFAVDFQYEYPTDIADIAENDNSYARVLSQYKNNSLLFIPLVDVFCKLGTCIVGSEVENELFFFDSNHLTLLGAKKLENKLIDYMEVK